MTRLAISLFTFVVLASSIIACQTVWVPPNEAIVQIKADIERSRPRDFRYADFQVVSSERQDLTAANKANGVTEAWIVKVKYIYWSEGGSKWIDDGGRYCISKTNNMWEVESFWPGFFPCPR